MRLQPIERDFRATRLHEQGFGQNAVHVCNTWHICLTMEYIGLNYLVNYLRFGTLGSTKYIFAS